MAKKSTEKKYKFTTRDGYCTLQMLTKGKDGRAHSASCEYPFIGENGRKLSRQQTIEHLLQLLAPHYPVTK